MSVIRFRKVELKNSVIHYSVIFLFLGGLFFFFSTPYLFEGNATQIDNGTGEVSVQSLENIDIKIDGKRYDPEENVVEILVSVLPKGIQHVDDLEYLMEEEKHKISLPSEKIKVSDKFYVFVVKEVPKDWEVIHFSVAEPSEKTLETDENEPSNEGKKSVARYTFLENKMERQTDLLMKDKQKYGVRYVEVQLEQVEVKMKNIEEKIKEEQEKIAYLEKEIEELDGEKMYQTEEEKQDSGSEISLRQSNMEASKKTIEELEKILQGLTEKVSLLEQKRKDM